MCVLFVLTNNVTLPTVIDNRCYYKVVQEPQNGSL